MYLGHGALFEFGYGHRRSLTRQIPQGDGLYSMTPLGRSGNYFVNSTQTSERRQLLAKLTLPPLTLLGKHRVVAGIDLDTREYAQNAHRTGYQQYDAAGLLLWRTLFMGPSQLRVTNAEASWYLMDNWNPRQQRPRSNMGSDRTGIAWPARGRLLQGHRSPTRRGATPRLSTGYTVSRDETSLQLFSRPFDQRSGDHTLLTEWDAGRTPKPRPPLCCPSRTRKWKLSDLELRRGTPHLGQPSHRRERNAEARRQRPDLYQ